MLVVEENLGQHLGIRRAHAELVLVKLWSSFRTFAKTALKLNALRLLEAVLSAPLDQSVDSCV